MKYRLMARMFHEFRHHQQGPDYETREEAEKQVKHWDGVGRAIAHVEPVPAHRRHHREATT